MRARWPYLYTQESSSFLSSQGSYHLILPSSESVHWFIASTLRQVATFELAIMSTDIVLRYGPGMSFYRSQIQPSRRKSGLEQGSLRKYCVALRELTTTNKLLESRVRELCSESLRLSLDVSTLGRHVSAFHGNLLAIWQADTLTRLIEVIYQRHGWKLPGGLLVGHHNEIDRDMLSGLYTMAARKIKLEAVTKKAVGLSEQYHLALQRYGDIVHFRSTDPFRSEYTFAHWLVSAQSTHPAMYRFWEKLYPVCYDRTVQESSELLI